MAPTPATQRLIDNKAKKIVDDAYAGRYAVPAVCCYNLEGILATVRAAKAKKSPAIVQLFPFSIDFADGVMLHAAAEAAATASVPVAVHMDHAQSPVIIRRAADLGGFDGIMVDMSHYERDENMRLSRELVAYCNARGILAECEPGRINGSEDGVAATSNDMQEILTTPEQAEAFVDLGIHWLAPAIGNIHGPYPPGGPQLDWPRLAAIRDQVGDRVRIVLHGAHEGYFTEELMRQCIDHGTAKININGVMNREFVRVAMELAGKVPLTTMMEKQVQAMQAVVEQNMDWMKSAGKAA